MKQIQINEDDYNEIEHEHSLAMRDLEALRIADFASANDILMRLQDRAYQLGLERGKKEQQK